jgi:DNA-binding transcriptional ArsR family regulator
MEQKDKNVKDNLKEMAVLKAQKLASATYLISGFLHDNDPLKWHLREQSLAIAKLVNPLNPEVSLSAINQMIGYLDIALLAHQVSEMNLSILKQEYQSLGELLLREKQPLINEQLPSPTPYLAENKSPAANPVSPEPTKRQIESQPTLPVKTTEAASSRRDQILRFLKSHGESSIKDISRAVPAVSNKTVQRELSDLVRLGQVSREGDRRWSRYRLIP